MSLEERLEALTAALEAKTAALNEVIGLTKEGGAAAPKTTTKRTTKPATAAPETTAGNDGGADNNENGGAEDLPAKVAELRKDVGEWLKEFAKAEDKDNPAGAHPEVAARAAALRAALDKVKAGLKIGDITDANDFQRVHTWFHDKAKKVDKGFGIGRLAADPAPAGASNDDIDI